LLPATDSGVVTGLAPEVGRAPTFEHFKQDAERSFLLSKLREHGWNVAETARTLDMPRSNLYKKIEKYQLTREDS
ncbi:MAG TPA: helix-turn-helix domain-containing protein, partial [Gemmatimonadales bacterium]